MKKKTVLITGTSSGVGKSLVEHLAKDYHVVAIARNTDNSVKMDNVSYYQADLNNIDQVNKCLEIVLKEHGNIDYLINNAGVMIGSELIDLSFEKLQESMNVNVIAPMAIMKKLIPLMRKHNFGRVINITSGAPLNCSENFGAYSASKGALNALTITAAKENLNYNIKINLMSPGPCKTKMAPQGTMEPSACHPTVDYLLNLDDFGPTGEFFWLGHKIPLFPNLEGVNWLKGSANEGFEKIL